jgi:hypothetical protein
VPPARGARARGVVQVATVTLRIAQGLRLPAEAVTETFAILAKRGMGKTYTASVLAEELLGAGLQTVIADPIGVWWGLRSSADGKSAGLPIAVFGGDHADVPLEATGGKLVADLVVDERLSCVLDLSLLRKGEQAQFMTAFAETLYHRNRAPLMLILDEADAFAPQKPMRGTERLLGAIEDLVRRGRARGIGVTLVTQRSAVLNKDVLTQAEVLVTLRTIAPQDREAIDAWVKVHGTPEQREQLMASLPSLPIGEAWFWSPGWLDVFQRVQIRRRRTFDSSATPKAGQTQTAPKTVADVDLQAITKAMAATIEKAKADDPRELRRRIHELERKVADQASDIPQAIPEPEVRIERVEVPVLNGEVDRLEEATSRMVTVGQALVQTGKDIGGIAEQIVLAAGDIRTAISRVGSQPSHPPPPPPPSQRPPRRPVPPRNREVTEDGPTLGRAERTLLNVLAAFPEGRTKVQLSILSGYSIRSSSFANALGALRSLGLAEGREPTVITAAGREVAGDVEPVPQGAALLEHWRGQLGRAERSLLDVFVAVYPAELTREELSERSGYSQTSSSFANAIGRLRSLRLVDGMRASEDLF